MLLFQGGQVVEQYSEIVRRIYDLGRVAKLILYDVGSLTYVFVNDPTKICVVPIMRKYYSDISAIVPIMNLQAFRTKRVSHPDAKLSCFNRKKNV